MPHLLTCRRVRVAIQDPGTQTTFKGIRLPSGLVNRFERMKSTGREPALACMLSALLDG